MDVIAADRGDARPPGPAQGGPPDRVPQVKTCSSSSSFVDPSSQELGPPAIQSGSHGLSNRMVSSLQSSSSPAASQEHEIYSDSTESSSEEQERVVRLCGPLQQSGNRCIKPSNIFSCTRDKLCAFHLRQTGMSFCGAISDICDGFVGLASRKHVSEPDRDCAMEPIQPCQHVRAKAVTPSAEGNAQAELSAAIERIPARRNIGLQTRSACGMRFADLVQLQEEVIGIPGDQRQRQIRLCGEMMVDARLANADIGGQIGVAKPVIAPRANGLFGAVE